MSHEIMNENEEKKKKKKEGPWCKHNVQDKFFNYIVLIVTSLKKEKKKCSLKSQQ